MLSVLIEGTLTAAPVARTGTKGNAFTTAQLRTAGEDGETVWCSVIAFSATAAETLAALAEGDTVAIAGSAALHHWQKQGGEHRVGLRVTASRVMTAYETGQRTKNSGPCARARDRGQADEGEGQ
jgi:single-stranded DNA-binding protein